MCLNKPDEYLPDPYPGESLPSQLMCWMVSGSRLSLLPSDSQPSGVGRRGAAELEKHDILVEGSPSDRITRAEKHGLTIRKPARLTNTEEARAVLYSREAAITGSTIAELCDQVERLYAVEDSPNYGYPRLKDRTGTSLFQHLHKDGLVNLSAQEDAKRKIPKSGWMSAGDGLPIDMSVVRLRR
jgi:hypothetical protein